MKRMICREVQEYIDIVRGGEVAVCKEQVQMCDFLERVMRTEPVYFDEDQLQRYLGLQKYFPYKLLPWEVFCFAVHNCLYSAPGKLRFPVLVVLVGRGAGKNGFLAFEDFALITPINGVMKYHIDIFATSEEQASATFNDIYDILDSDEKTFKGKFEWNKEVIRNVKTKSEIRFRTSNPKTKDGGRPGKVDFDEYHAYKDFKLINVAVTGLGKKKYPRRTIISTQGDERDGPLDKLLGRCERILEGAEPDNGTFPFICRVESREEIKDRRMWDKANPSLRYFEDLQQEIEMEFVDYLSDPINNSAFATKRMNYPMDDMDTHFTEWNNILETNREVVDLEGQECICGIDYASFDDMASVYLLFKIGDQRYGITHSWICRHSKDWDRIQFPLEEAEKDGLLTIVHDVEIDPEMLTEWIYEKSKLYRIRRITLDSFRYQLLKVALRKIGFEATKGEESKVHLVRKNDVYMVAPKVMSIFNKHQMIWGNNALMRWFAWNVKMTRKNGNTMFEKIEEKSRKTDGFMAMVHAICDEELLKERNRSKTRLPTLVYGG